MLTVHSILLTVLWLASGPLGGRMEHSAVVPDRDCGGIRVGSTELAAVWNAIPTQTVQVLCLAVAYGEETLSGRPPEMRPRNPRFLPLGIPRTTHDAFARRLKRRSPISNWVPSFESTADFSTLLGRFQI